MSELEQVIDGIHHWSAFHEGIQQPTHSYYLPDQRLAIDPMAADGVLERLRELGGVERIALTNRHHLRGSGSLIEEFGCEVVAPAPGMHEFSDGLGVRPYEWGEQIADGVTALEVGAICPDDGALHIAIGPGALALADGVIELEGELSFVPDFLMDDPEAVRPAQHAALRRLLEDYDFDALLLAHGPPRASGAKRALQDFIDS